MGETIQLEKDVYEKLMRDITEFKSLISSKEKDKETADFRERVDKAVADIIDRRFPKVDGKMVFGKATDEQKKSGFSEVGIQKFLNMVKFADPKLKTIMYEGSDAQGNYTVPIEYMNSILGALNNIASLPAKCTQITMGAPTVNFPKWLTDLTIYWVAEDGDKTLTKPTFTQLQMVLKKMAAIVPFSDELLDDNIVNLDSQINTLIGENIGLEIERVALVGSVAGGDPFNGVVNTTGVINVAQGAANLAYEDLVDVVNNTTILERYNQGAEWFMNRLALSIILKLKDNNNKPMFDTNTLLASKNLLGFPINITDQISNATSPTKIILGNPKYILLGNSKKNPGINVAVSNSAVTPSSGSVTQNAFIQDETWFRFVQRQAIANVSQAFRVLTGVK